MRRALLWAGVLLALPTLAVVAASQPEGGTPDVPKGNGAIRGRVVQAETGEPLASVDVALYALSAEGLPGLRQTTSDAQGRFVFEGIATSANLAYLLGARYQGVPFPGARVSFAAGETEREVDIPVTSLSSDAGALVAGPAERRLQRTGGGLRVVETLHVENPGPRTFHVPAEGRAGATPALRARLPEGATGFSMPLGVIPDGVEQEGREVRWWGPVHPGVQDLSFSFEVPAPEEAERIALEWELPTGASALRLWIPAGAGLETPELAEAPLAPGEGAGFAAYDGGPRAPGSRVVIALRVPPAKLAAAGAVHTKEVRLIVTADDAAVAISESHVLEIRGDERVFGTADAPLHYVPLPSGAGRLRFGADGAGVSMLPDARGGLAVVGEAEPGELRVEVAYREAVDGFPVALERSWPVPVPLLSIFLADPGNLAPRSERLHRRRPVRTSDLTYMHLEAFEVEADERVALQIDRRPPRARFPALAFQGLLAIGGALALALLVGPLWRSGPVDELAAETESAASRERAAVVDALRDLEHDFETGHVAAEEYESLRGELRARALELMAEERGLRAPDSPAPPAETASGSEPGGEPALCNACGALPDPSHRFCAQCGAALPGGDA